MGAPTDLAKTLKWQDPSKFSVQITGSGASKGGLDAVPPNVLSAAITSITLADINTSPIEDYIGEEWRFATGRLENYLVTITMKDYDNFKLYRIWSSAIQKFLREYPKSQMFNVVIQTADDFSVTGYVKIAEFKDCILTTVSGPTLDNSAIASIAEFSVTMKASYVKS